MLTLFEVFFQALTLLVYLVIFCQQQRFSDFVNHLFFTHKMKSQFSNCYHILNGKSLVPLLVHKYSLLLIKYINKHVGGTQKTNNYSSSLT
jgi:hypothetical protein